MSGALLRERLGSVVVVRTPTGMGTGFYVTSSGVIVTNQHVVGPLLRTTVQRYDRSQREVRVVRAGVGYDLALLWDQSEKPPPPLPLGDPASVAPGDGAYAIGHPVGLEFTITRGIVSASNRVIQRAVYIQTDATTHPGSSGGPLLNEKGEVIGVSTMGLKEDGVNFALSVRYVRELLGQLVLRAPTPGFVRCVLCGAKNNVARRSCRKCGVAFGEGEPAPPSQGRSSGGEPGEDRVTRILLDGLDALDPKPEPPPAPGSVMHTTYKGVRVELVVLSAPVGYVSVRAPLLDVTGRDAASTMRSALEANLDGTIDAKLALRGSEIYVAAERATDGLAAADVAALVRRVVEVKERLANLGAEAPARSQRVPPAVRAAIRPKV